MLLTFWEDGAWLSLKVPPGAGSLIVLQYDKYDMHIYVIIWLFTFPTFFQPSMHLQQGWKKLKHMHLLYCVYLGCRTWRLSLFAIFQTVSEAVPKEQSWSQFMGLNAKETTSCPACGWEQSGSAFSQFLHQKVMITITLPLSPSNWKHMVHSIGQCSVLSGLPHSNDVVRKRGAGAQIWTTVA